MKSVEPLSPRAYQLAEEYQLGEPRLASIFTRQYISSSEERLLWIQVEQVEVSGERIVISERGASQTWLSLPVQQIPNLCVLLALLKHIGKYA